MDCSQRTLVETSLLSLGDLTCDAFCDERLCDSPADVVEAFDDSSLDGVAAQAATPRLGELFFGYLFDELLPRGAESVDRRKQWVQRPVDVLERADPLPRDYGMLGHNSIVDAGLDALRWTGRRPG